MSELKIIKEARKYLVEKLITKESVESLKKRKMYKGSVVKALHDVILTSKYTQKEKMSNEERYFFDGKINVPKVVLSFLILIMFVVFLCSSLLGNINVFIVFSNLIFLSVFPIIAVLKLNWFFINKKINKKMDYESVKKVFFEKYKRDDIENFIDRELTLEEIKYVFNEITRVFLIDKIIKTAFKYQKVEKKDVTDPVILLLILQDLIQELEEEQEEIILLKESKEYKEKNEKIIKNILK